jgi:hypothetical protein
VGDEPVEQVFHVGGTTHWINVGVATVVCSLPAWCRGSSCRPNGELERKRGVPRVARNLRWSVGWTVGGVMR